MNDDPRQAAIRTLRQRFESLRRAGLDRVPVVLPDSASVGPSAVVAPSTTRREPKPEAARPDPREQADPSEPTRQATGISERAAPASPASVRGSGEKSVRQVLATTPSLFGAEGFDEPVSSPEERPVLLQAMSQEVADCTRCPQLAETRSRTVFGVGNPDARLMFIGEAPGADEDRLGEPFVGRAGQLLTDMLTKGMGLEREDVYIANILKCRPPGNRDPQPEEVANCIGYLERQIATIRPEYLCLLGRIAAQRLLDTAMPLARLRGRWHRYRGIPTLVTYHPAYLLRNPAGKAEAWEDLKMIMRAMGLQVPERKSRPKNDP